MDQKEMSRVEELKTELALVEAVGEIVERRLPSEVVKEVLDIVADEIREDIEQLRQFEPRHLDREGVRP